MQRVLGEVLEDDVLDGLTITNTVDHMTKTIELVFQTKKGMPIVTTIDLATMFSDYIPAPSDSAVLIGWLPEGKGEEHTVVEQDIIDSGPEVYAKVTAANVHRYNCPYTYHPTVPLKVEMHPYCWIPKDVAPEWKGTSYWSGFIDTWPKWDFTVDGVEGTLAVNNLRSQHGPTDYIIDYPEGAKYVR